MCWQQGCAVLGSFNGTSAGLAIDHKISVSSSRGLPFDCTQQLLEHKNFVPVASTGSSDPVSSADTNIQLRQIECFYSVDLLCYRRPSEREQIWRSFAVRCWWGAWACPGNVTTSRSVRSVDQPAFHKVANETDLATVPVVVNDRLREGGELGDLHSGGNQHRVFRVEKTMGCRTAVGNHLEASG